VARDRLTALQVKRAHEKGEPVLPDGAGLYLRKQSASGTAWTLRYRFGGRDRWMALGSYPDMELADARKAARAKRTLVDAGRAPLLEKQSEIYALKVSAAKKALSLSTLTRSSPSLRRLRSEYVRRLQTSRTSSVRP
jgi:hypothetical protein